MKKLYPLKFVPNLKPKTWGSESWDLCGFEDENRRALAEVEARALRVKRTAVLLGADSERVEAIVHKTVFNSSGSQTLRFRCVDPQGNTVTRTTDYWTAYIGRINTHLLRGCMTGSPAAGYTQMINNVQ